VLLDVTVLLTL